MNELAYATNQCVRNLKIYLQEYQEGEKTQKFTNSQFIVLVNRMLAFLLSFAYLQSVEQKPHNVPYYKFSFSSFSNIMSSWFQYEALKYVTFPTQVSAFSVWLAITFGL